MVVVVVTAPDWIVERAVVVVVRSNGGRVVEVEVGPVVVRRVVIRWW